MEWIFDILILIYYALIAMPFETFKNVFKLRTRFENKVKIDGKVVIITGGNTGIGKHTALELASRGAQVIIGCRDVVKGKKATEEILALKPSANITVLTLDLSSLKSVREFAKQVSEVVTRVDILINNAGVMMCPEWQTEDGFEMQFGTNHLGHFLLTLTLMPLLKKSPKARIVNVSSIAHLLGKIHFGNINLRNKAYTPMKAYGQSKLANILFTRELSKRLGPESNVNVYSLHPGVIKTEIWRHLINFPLRDKIENIFFINPELGSQTSLYCALEPSLDTAGSTGSYYEDCKRVDDKCMFWRARDESSARLLWDLSCDLVELEEHLKL